jgi:serine/threonine protein kinase
VAGNFTYNASTRTATFTPSGPMQYDTMYELHLGCVNPESRRNPGGYEMVCVKSFRTIKTSSIQLIISRPATKQTLSGGFFEVAGLSALKRLQSKCARMLAVVPSAVQSLFLLTPSGVLTPLASDASVAALATFSLISVQCAGDPSVARNVPTRGIEVPVGMATVACVGRNQLSIEAVLNTGGSSVVHAGKWKRTNVAIKMLRSDQGERTLSVLNAELEVLSGLHHPRVVTLMGLCRDLGAGEGAAALVLERMENGSLFNVLHPAASSSRQSLTLLQKLRVALDVCEGMRFLHDSNIAHRDLKSANVLLNSDWRAKISDFGLSSFYATQMTHMTGVQATPGWSAPEILIGDVFRNSADVYSFGVLLWELFSERVPWEGKTIIQIISLVGMQHQKLTDVPVQFVAVPNAPSASTSASATSVPINGEACTKILDVVNACFQDADKRPSFADLHGSIALIVNCQLAQRQVQLGLPSVIPPSFYCSITTEVMTDPVICSDGHTYERAAIELWLQHSNRSPLTNLELANRTLIPNLALKPTIAEYMAWIGQPLNTPDQTTDSPQESSSRSSCVIS